MADHLSVEMQVLRMFSLFVSFVCALSFACSLCGFVLLRSSHVGILIVASLLLVLIVVPCLVSFHHTYVCTCSLCVVFSVCYRSVLLHVLLCLLLYALSVRSLSLFMRLFCLILSSGVLCGGSLLFGHALVCTLSALCVSHPPTRL